MTTETAGPQGSTLAQIDIPSFSLRGSPPARPWWDRAETRRWGVLLQVYECARMASNSHCEDNFAHAVMVDPVNTGTDWMAWAVFDGQV